MLILRAEREFESFWDKNDSCRYENQENVTKSSLQRLHGHS